MAAGLLVVRLGSLGDLIHTLPAVAALRRTHPDARIDWLVDRVHRGLLDLVPTVTDIVTLDRPSARGWWAARRRLRQRSYDLAIDFQGLLKSAALSRLAGASEVMGFDRRSAREPAAALFYGRRVDARGASHVIHKNLALAEAAGAAAGPIEFPLADVTSEALDRIQAQIGHRFAVLNPGAAWPNKRWPTDRLGRLALWLASRHDLRSVAIWGPGEEALAAEVVGASAGAAVAAPATGLADLVAIVRAARLVVSGDTGPTHIAAAVGTPVVALFGPTDPARNGPWDARDRILSQYDRCACHYERVCRRETSAWCLGRISLADIEAAVGERLATT